MANQSVAFGPAKYGLRDAPASLADSQTNHMAAMSPDDHDGVLTHPNNPLLAFGVIGAVVFGLMAFSTSVRVGKTTAGIKIGETGS